MNNWQLEAGKAIPAWQPGTVPVAVVMISLNEGHNMGAVLENLKGWAQEVFLVDSYSSDETVDIALRYGVYVVQRHFRGFGDQWNFALQNLPITAPWTMKLDPDERLSEELKTNIKTATPGRNVSGFALDRRLWFMGRPLPIRQRITRIWRTGYCRFSDVLVNEHPVVQGRIEPLKGDLEHYDSPHLHHWYDKQNYYSTAEALDAYRGSAMAAEPRLFGSPLERRMWFKRVSRAMPMSFVVFLYCYGLQGAWKAGRVGFIWSRLRGNLYRMRAWKLYEMHRTGREIRLPVRRLGSAHPAAIQAGGE